MAETLHQSEKTIDEAPSSWGNIASEVPGFDQSRALKARIAELERITREQSQDISLTQEQMLKTRERQELQERYNQLSKLQYLEELRRQENKYHRADRIKFLKGEYQPTADDEKMWAKDGNFWQSKEVAPYRDAALEKLYPDVYKPSKEQLIAESNKYLYRPTRKELVACRAAFDESFEQGVRSEVNLLSRTFDLASEPEIVFEKPDPLMQASYNYMDNQIIVYGQEESDNLSILSTIGTIAHEMWHAHQEDIIRDKSVELPEQARRYRQNGEYIYQLSKNPKQYMQQVLEAEAFQFGYDFLHRVAAENEKNPFRRFLRRREVKELQNFAYPEEK